MKGIFGPYVLWPLNKKLIFWIVTRVSARDYTVHKQKNALVETVLVIFVQVGDPLYLLFWILKLFYKKLFLITSIDTIII